MTFGKKLKEILHEKNISRSKLAEMTGFSRQAVDLWVNDGADISAFNLIKVSNALQIDPQILMSAIGDIKQGAAIDKLEVIKQLDTIEQITQDLKNKIQKSQ